MGFFKWLFGSEDEGLTLEQAAEVQAAILAQIGETDDRTTKINLAAQLLVGRHFEGAIQAYESIARDYPDEQATAQSQIGAAKYFLGRYEEAIGHYESARELGADPDMMQDNIDEAREALAS